MGPRISGTFANWDHVFVPRQLKTSLKWDFLTVKASKAVEVELTSNVTQKKITNFFKVIFRCIFYVLLVIAHYFFAHPFSISLLNCTYCVSFYPEFIKSLVKWDIFFFFFFFCPTYQEIRLTGTFAKWDTYSMSRGSPTYRECTVYGLKLLRETYKIS